MARDDGPGIGTIVVIAVIGVFLYKRFGAASHTDWPISWSLSKYPSARLTGQSDPVSGKPIVEYERAAWGYGPASDNDAAARERQSQGETQEIADIEAHGFVVHVPSTGFVAQPPPPGGYGWTNTGVEYLLD
jgi:hypothetical protein